MNRLALFAVALPLTILAAWVTRLNWLERSATEVRLGVSGFDPRDLLAGHYLTYTVNYGPITPCPQDHELEFSDTCVCLTENVATKTHETTWAGACDSRPRECTLFLAGQCRYDRFEANIERFYFPETFQSVLAVVPDKSTISVAVTPTGQGIVTGFAVDGVDVLDYAKTRTNEQ